MKSLNSGEKIGRVEASRFIFLLLQQAFQLLHIAIFNPRNTVGYGAHFATLYSKLWDYAEHSISNRGFNLPSTLGNGPVQTVNKRLASLYNATYACLSFSGSSGAMLLLLTAVLPKLQTERHLVLFDELSHQSTVGGLIFGRWKAVRIQRNIGRQHGAAEPINCNAIKKLVEKHGANKVAAIVLVLPSYDGFRSRSEEIEIYHYAKSKGIFLFIDGAWDAAGFRGARKDDRPIVPPCDAWITSPHKRGLSPSSVGCMVTNNQAIARLWDEALDLGFRSSSISFVDIMIAEHRIQNVIEGNWAPAFAKAEIAAFELSNRISEVHPDVYVVMPEHVGAESSDPTHILISTSNITGLDARIWSRHLSESFGLDVEKSTANSLLLLCASPGHRNIIDQTLAALRDALNLTLQSIKAV